MVLRRRKGHDPDMILLGVTVLVLVVLFLAAAAAAEPSLSDQLVRVQGDVTVAVDESAWDGYGWRSLGA